MLQLAIAFVGLAVLALLSAPWFFNVEAMACTPEDERAGECILGVHDRALFGALAFMGMLGAAFAFVLRKGVLDFPPPGPVAEDEREAGVGDLDTVRRPPTGKDERTRVRTEPPVLAPSPTSPEPHPRSEAGWARDEVATSEPAKAEDEPAPSESESDDARPAGHRRLDGPVFRAFVDDQVVDLEVAIKTAAQRLRSERVAVVFSRGASVDANEALLELAEAFDASRYVLEGTAAAAEGIPTGDKPDPHAADEIAGPDARHAGELALNLAGSFIQTVFLLDTRVRFPEFVLGKLTELQSVCIAHAHDDVSAACQVVLPGTNPGEREGELIDSGGGTNSRRPRAWLVKQIVAALRELDAPRPGTPADDAPVSES
jgi:hypothetical protein